MLLSIITVVLNCFDTIERTINSVINQNFDDMEYIIIDGGSIDGTIDIIKKYEDKISYWISEPDKGIYDAMNKGIKIASGEWIAFMNANDWYEPNALQKVTSILDKDCPNSLYGKVNRIEHGKKNGYIGISEEENPENLHIRNLYCHQGLFIKKELFNHIGLYDCSYQLLADYDWNLKAHAQGLNPQFLDVCVANYTMGGVSSGSNSIHENIRIIIKNYLGHPDIDYLKNKIGQKCFDYLYADNEYIYKDLIREEKDYYIWGTGVYGEKIYEIIKRISSNVTGFIDSNSKKTNFKDKKVFFPEEVLKNDSFINDENCLICIATEKYEKEIENIINKNNISKEKYISISQFFNIALENILQIIFKEQLEK